MGSAQAGRRPLSGPLPVAGASAAGWWQLRWWGESALPARVHLLVEPADGGPCERLRLTDIGSPGCGQQHLVQLAHPARSLALECPGAELRCERWTRRSPLALGLRLLRAELKRLGGWRWLRQEAGRTGWGPLLRRLHAYPAVRLAAEAAALREAAQAPAVLPYLAAADEPAPAPPPAGIALAGQDPTAPLLVLLDPGVRLAPGALAAITAALAADPGAAGLYGDEDLVDASGVRSAPWHKPAWSPDLLLGGRFTGSLLALRAEVWRQLGSGAVPTHDLVLRLAESGARVLHLPRILAHRPAAAPAAQAADGVAVRAALARCGIAARLAPVAACAPLLRVSPVAQGRPLVSAIIPTRDHADLLAVCLEGLFGPLTAGVEVEAVVVDNGSREPATAALFARWRARQPDRFRVLACDEPFNFSRLTNLGAAQARGGHLLLLNNDIEMVEPGWLAEMLGWLQQPGIGFVGARLLYPDRSVQHAGVALGVRGVCGHIHRGAPGDDPAQHGRVLVAHDVGAATGACLLLPTALYRELGGLDEQLPVTYNDIDLCLNVRARGLRGVVAPATLVHHESKSRGSDASPERRARAEAEFARLIARHGRTMLDDPYHSPWFDPQRDECLSLMPGRGPVAPARHP